MCQLYNDEISEIIVVDNNSDAKCLDIYKKYESKVKVISLSHFTYGRGLNIGIEAAKNKWILLMSSQCLPVGNFFFKEISKNIECFGTKQIIAGLRLTMQQKTFDYKRYLDFTKTTER